MLVENAWIDHVGQLSIEKMNKKYPQFCPYSEKNMRCNLACVHLKYEKNISNTNYKYDILIRCGNGCAYQAKNLTFEGDPGKVSKEDWGHP